MRAVREGARSPAVRVFWAGTAVACLFAALELANAGGRWLLYADVQLVVAPLAGAVAVWRSMAGRTAEERSVRRGFAVSLALTALGQLLRDVPDVVPVTAGIAGVASDAAYVFGAAVGIRTLLWTMYSRLEPEWRKRMMVDGVIIILTATALVIALWQQSGRFATSTGLPFGPGDLGRFLTVLVSALFFASAVAATLVALALRISPRLHGVWASIAGVVLLASAWAGWLARFIAQEPDGVEPMDFLFLAGAGLLGYGGLTWRIERGGGRRFERLAAWATEWLPFSAVLVAGIADVAVRQGLGAVSPASVLAWLVALAAMVRMRVTQVAERVASERLTREVEERAATSAALARLEAGDSPEATARRVCDEAMRLPGIDSATVYAFDGPQAVVALAVSGLRDYPMPVGAFLPPAYARVLRHHADFGLWLEQWAAWPAGDEFARKMLLAGLHVEALAPLYWNDQPFGLLAFGTASAEHATTLTDRLPALTEFSLVAAALLGPMVAERRAAAELQHQLRAVIEDAAFETVFQPFVDLTTGAVVGHEALTRFLDRRPPDVRFVEAASVGMGTALEKACLLAQLKAEIGLPPNTWLSLNVSPQLAVAEGPWLVDALDTATHPIVIEITEHDEIADYGRLHEALEAVRRRARLAVDDAGAGYAGLRHILELRPQFVKLDITLVHSIDTDPARQAMVAGMAHFAAIAGCELIAEGIETPGEMEVLRQFGVHYGQGYLIGRPAPLAVAFSDASAA